MVDEMAGPVSARDPGRGTMTTRHGRSLALAVVLTLGACTSGSEAGNAPPPDLIVHDAIVLTMDSDMPRASAFAVTGDRFVAVGSDETSSPWSVPAPP